MPTSTIAAALDAWRAAERDLLDLTGQTIDRREAELRVVCRWLEYQAAARPSTEVIIVADADRRFVAASGDAEGLFGRSIIGLRAEDITAPVRASKADDRYRRFESRGRMRGMFPIQRPDGSVRWVRYQAQADIPVAGYSHSRLFGALGASRTGVTLG